MIKQIPSKEVKDYIKNNSKCILLDVRTKEEWNEGRPDGDKIGLTPYFLSLQFAVYVKIQTFFLALFSKLRFLNMLREKVRWIIKCR